MKITNNCPPPRENKEIVLAKGGAIIRTIRVFKIFEYFYNQFHWKKKKIRHFFRQFEKKTFLPQKQKGDHRGGGGERNPNNFFQENSKSSDMNFRWILMYLTW
jgi:hypothetical protein